MKKTKLITSLCLLVLTFACLTFGVYSAVKTSFTASGTITFYAYECDITIDGTIEGAVQKEGGTPIQTTYKGSNKAGHSGYTAGENGTIPTWTMGDMAFDELNVADGKTTADSVIRISFYFYSRSTQASDGSALNLKITADITAPSGLNVTNDFDNVILPAGESCAADITIKPGTTAVSGALSIVLKIEPYV